MAYAHTAAAPTLPQIGSRFFFAIDRLRLAYLERRDTKRTIRALSRLTARELDDLGLTAEAIPAAARESARR